MSANAPASDHLVHGMGKVLEPPAWPAINAGEAEAVLAHFPQASMAWDDYLIGHARWFGSDNGKSFLRQLREGMGL